RRDPHRDAYRVPHLLPARPRGRVRHRLPRSQLTRALRRGGRSGRWRGQPLAGRRPAVQQAAGGARVQPGRRPGAARGERLAPGGGPPSAAASAAAALRITASRTGPGSPPSTPRATAALCAASPPRRSPGLDTGSPSTAGSSTVWLTSPPCTTHTVDVSAVVS